MAATFELAKLIVNVLADTSKLKPTIDGIHKQLDDLHKKGMAPAISKEAVESAVSGLLRLKEGFGEATSQLTLLLGVSGHTSAAMSLLGTEMLSTAAAAGPLGIAIVAATAVLAGLIALVVKGTERFIEFSDQLIKTRSLLRAFGGGTSEELKNMEAWMSRIGRETGVARDRLIELYTEARRVTALTSSPEANARAIVQRAIAIAAVTKRDVESVARELALILEIGHNPRGRLEELRNEVRRLGPEFRIHRRDIMNVADAWNLIDEVAAKGMTATREQLNTTERITERLQLSINELWTAFSKSFGPIVVGMIQGLVDALTDLADMFKAVVEAFGIEDWEAARDIWRDVTFLIFRPMLDTFRGIASAILAAKTAMDLLVYSTIRLGEVTTRSGDAMSKAFWADVIAKDTAAGQKLLAGVISENTRRTLTGKVAAEGGAGLEKITDIGRVSKAPEFSGLADFWRKLQQGALTGVTADPVRLAQKQLSEAEKQTKILQKVEERLSLKPAAKVAIAG